jgi:tetratricopeptide (TPR) repeat protein
MRRVCRYLLILTLALMATTAAGAALAVDREKATAAYREGNGFFDQGRFAEAAAAYGRAIEEDPQYAEAYHNQALANEMVDRQKAIEGWRRFLEVAADRPDLKYDLARVKARLQILEALPPLPAAMQPSRYVPAAGDYYWLVSHDSEGEEWRRLPVKVFLGSAPEIKWQQGAREAYNIWSDVFPLELVALPQNADVRMGWEEAVLEKERVGEEIEWVQIRRVGGELTGRRIAVIVIDVRRPWTKDEMRAIVLHELGHALGIKGHSDSPKDIMYGQMQEKIRQLPVPVINYPLYWRSLVKQPSQRDVNTLIRLYNFAGSSTRFP